MVTSARCSFIIPTHNRSELIAAAVARVLAQSVPPWEIVVVDDGSTDSTAAVLATIDHANVRCLAQANAGPSTARNVGAAAATGDVLVFVDDDDELDPHWIEKMMAPFTDASVAVVCCGATLRRTDTATTRASPVRPMGPAYSNVRGNFDTGTYAVRRDVFVAAGAFADGLASGEHHELALRLTSLVLERGWQIAAVDEPLVVIHQRPSALRSSNAPRKRYDSAMYMLEHHGERLSRGGATYLTIAAVNAARLDDFPHARKLLRRSLRVDARRVRNYGRLLLASVPPLGRRVWKVSEWRDA